MTTPLSPRGMRSATWRPPPKQGIETPIYGWLAMISLGLFASTAELNDLDKDRLNKYQASHWPFSAG